MPVRRLVPVHLRPRGRGLPLRAQLARVGPALGIVAAVVAAALAAVGVLDGDWSMGGVRRAVEAAGPWAPAVYVAAFVVGLVVLLPATPFLLAAGFLFGPVAGVAWAWIGAVAGAVAAFVVARTGAGPVVRTMEGRFPRIARYLAGNTFLAVLAVRLVPVLPFNVLNYACGLLGVRPRAFVAGTALGFVPVLTAYVLVGAALGSAGDWRSAAFLVPLAGALALVVLAAVVGPRLTARAVAERVRPRVRPHVPPARARPPG